MGPKESGWKVPKCFFISKWKSDKVLPVLWFYSHTTSGDPLALVGGNGTLGPPVQGEFQGASHFASPSRVAELQGQIKNLSEEQKRALQEQITRKQRQVQQREKLNNIGDVL